MTTMRDGDDRVGTSGAQTGSRRRPSALTARKVCHLSRFCSADASAATDLWLLGFARLGPFLRCRIQFNCKRKSLSAGGARLGYRRGCRIRSTWIHVAVVSARLESTSFQGAAPAKLAAGRSTGRRHRSPAASSNFSHSCILRVTASQPGPKNQLRCCSSAVRRAAGQRDREPAADRWRPPRAA
jgi:hypothetical protein